MSDTPLDKLIEVYKVLDQEGFLDTEIYASDGEMSLGITIECALMEMIKTVRRK